MRLAQEISVGFAEFEIDPAVRLTKVRVASISFVNPAPKTTGPDEQVAAAVRDIGRAKKGAKHPT